MGLFPRASQADAISKPVMQQVDSAVANFTQTLAQHTISRRRFGQVLQNLRSQSLGQPWFRYYRLTERFKLLRHKVTVIQIGAIAVCIRQDFAVAQVVVNSVVHLVRLGVTTHG